ncbi:uncharacterized protein TNCV_1354981 [Trichonephila clavipes]|uniref:Retrotransposon gag domain-containing protein n=1 Tax=Trichonephila clavipes TaxID=2585209 RepID=A0A8X6SF46_TRICX|nr:uncharacterized protein TNCV_1354981 [Trichonephila clavipes]
MSAVHNNLYTNNTLLPRISTPNQRVLRSEESSFTLYCWDGRFWDWNLPRERLLPECIVPTASFDGGHLLGKAQDWYQIFGTTLVQNTATDFAHLKAALSKAFPAIRNKKDLEIKFYASQHRRDQGPTDFIYDLLKLHKQLELGMSKDALVDHIFFRREPQVQDYVEVRNPQNTVQL